MSVASILQALAENAGQAQLRKGAIYGGLVSDVAQLPAAVIGGKQHQQAIDRQTAADQERLGFARNADTRAASDQSMQENASKLAAAKQAVNQQAWKVGAEGSGGDVSKFNIKAALDFVAQSPFPELQKDIHDHYVSLQPKLTEHDPTKTLVDPTGAVQVPAVPKPDPVTTATLDARQQFLLSKRASGVKLTPAEDAEVTGYNERKTSQTPRSLDEQLLEAIKNGDTAAAGTITQTMKTAAAAKGDPAAIAAANRQAATIAAQIAQQSRAQGFTEAQAGRAELTNKIETPYLDAREKADTLRNIVALAKSGNKEAASVQSLLGVLGLVTSEGVKRINTTELDQVAGAGSLFDKIKAKAGKVISGQPLPDDLQNDLVQLSNMLEQSARKKYEQGFKQVKTRYGLKDETALAPTGSPDKGAEGSVGGKPAVWDYRNDQWGWWPK